MLCGSVAAASVVRLIRCVRSGATLPPAPLPRTVWQAPQRYSNIASPRATLAVGGAGAGLICVFPKLERRRRFGDDQEAHMRVLRAAELGTLAAVTAGLFRLQPRHVRLARDGVGLAAQRGHPERVDHVGAGQLEPDGCPVGMWISLAVVKTREASLFR